MTHPIIKTDNYILIASDEDIQIGDYLHYLGENIYPIKTVLDRSWFEKLHDAKMYKKVIAHLPLNNSPILEGVPLLPPLDDEDEWELDNNKIDIGIEKNGLGYVNGYYGGFIDGIKEAKEKYKFTEEDVIKIVEKSRETGLTAEYLMLSLSQPKLPVGFKCEIEWDCCNRYINCKGCDATAEMINLRHKIINGVMQGEWIFE